MKRTAGGKRKAAKADQQVPKITIAGQSWPVPKLVPRQMREVHQPLIELNSRIGEARRDKGQNAVQVFAGLKRDDYNDLVLRPIYWALTRAHPNLDWEEFLDMEIEDTELYAAWFIVRDQSRIFQTVKEGAAEPTGE